MSNSQKFIVRGGKPLKGTIAVSGSKNAALPILCAALIAKTPSTFTNVPQIADVKSLLEIFSDLGVVVTREGSKTIIDPTNLKFQEPNPQLVQKMRASALLAAPLLARHKLVKMAFPGGCVLGKRTLRAHTYVFEKFGATILDEEKSLHVEMKAKNSQPLSTSRAQSTHTLVMPEASVTATENALVLAAATPGETRIRLAACEPHVQDLCEVLIKMGAKISGIGTHNLTITGAEKLQGVEHEIMGDYLEVGTYALAAAITKGDVTITGFPMHHLDSFWQKFDEAEIPYELTADTVRIHNVKKIRAIPQLKTAVHPSFPTDLQAPFAVILTQAEGISKIFETLFEGRLSYLFELEKMGARIEMLNPHQAIIIGPNELRGTEIASCDIRAGAAMVIAALGAKGQTTISNILYIDRGYERLDEKLRALGADIERISETEKKPENANAQNTISTVPSLSVRRTEIPEELKRDKVSA